MSDKQAHSPSATPPPTAADYEVMFAAVMETVRGRWFLAEYGKRNRNADTELILAALERAEARWRDRRAAPTTERMRSDLADMATAIAQARAEIAAIKPAGESQPFDAGVDLDSIVQASARATADIFAAAEHVQEIAWSLRERGAEVETCDALDRHATDIYRACAFQDLTGQRIAKVVEVLQFLEQYIAAMIAARDGVAPAPPLPAASPQAVQAEPPAYAAPSAPAIAEPAFGAAARAEESAPEPASGALAATAQDAVAASALAPAATNDVRVAPAVVGATAMLLEQPRLDPRSEDAAPQRAALAQPDTMRLDPASVLKRILTIIREPGDPALAPDAPSPFADMALLLSRGQMRRDTKAEPTAVGVAVTPPVADAPAEKRAPTNGQAPPAAAPGAEIGDDFADDILMPQPHTGALTVDEAVDQMLMKRPVRVEASQPAAAVVAVEPMLEALTPTTPEPAAASAAPVEARVERSPIRLDVPELTVPPVVEPVMPADERAQSPIEASARAEMVAPEREPEALPPVGVAVPITDEAPPQEHPSAVVLTALAEAPAPAVVAAPEQPVSTLAPMAAPVAAPAKPAPAVPPQPAVPRHAALAAITALSAEEKIALFS